MSMTWYRLNLGDAMLAGILLDKLEESFQDEYTKLDRPKDMALFIRHESEGRLHCEVIAYLSPSCTLIATTFGASPCSTPAPNDLSLKSGSEDAWKILFPDFVK